MSKNDVKETLPERDYLSFLELILQFHNCHTRGQLLTVLKDQLLPLFEAQTAFYAWTSPDGVRAKVADVVGLPEKDKVVLQESIPYNPLPRRMVRKSLKVSAGGIDISREEILKGAQRFFKERPQYRWEDFPYIGRDLSLVMMDVPEPSLGLIIQRNPPFDKPWTFREVRVCELLQPHLFQAIKSIFLKEELARYKSLADALADAPAPTAVVNSAMRAIFSNKAFNKLLPAKPGQRLPKKLADRLKREIGKLEPPYPAEPVELEFAPGRASKGEFLLTCAPLTNNVSGLGAFAEAAHWLIRMKPSAEPSAGINLSLCGKGLSAREIEVALLVRDGIDSREIGKRLFISRHTVKTHLKNIYSKLGVHSRAQLVSFLAKSGGQG